MILDASALLAFLLSEPGEARVADVLMQGATMATVNFAEVAAKYVARGATTRAETLLKRLPIVLVAMDADLAEQAALVADRSWPTALSLGDRVCFALGHRTEKTILTADRRWLDIGARVGTQIELLR
jgi:ribonuclease VapC